ncbi:F-box/LRR-repeat protein At3g03360-like [Salvia hispanica]|uniref:F-box/LRR-repeat protein At3g03360-like n=1 Tax=Salvia hispanica TaxID=49212 RepID=UPI002008FBEA|nr:F-box/LRR-repeat protein At3g03360-like [Salvia hispanica]
MALSFRFQGDGISMLPDYILVLILSSLTLKEAARTSTLCSRWRYLWTLTPTLDLQVDWIDTLRNYDIDELRHKYVEWVDRLLTKLPKASTTNLVKFRVLFDLSSYLSDRINDWLSYAVSRKAESIDLTLKANLPGNCYPFPYKQGNFPNNLKLLKKLSFSYVNVSCEVVAFLLGNCRLLEQLSLCGIPLSSLEVIPTSPVFKCLEISRCSALNSVVVRESKVVCIKYNGAGKPHCRFELVDVPLLTELWIQAKARQQYISALTDILSMTLCRMLR